jgi:protein-arginine kinase
VAEAISSSFECFLNNACAAGETFEDILDVSPHFHRICDCYRLQARGSAGVDSGFTGIFDLSNSERLGKSETDLVNIMLVGVTSIIKLEQKLAAGEDVSGDIPTEILDMPAIMELGKTYL